MKNVVKSCWNCKYQSLASSNFFGNCLYFETIGRKKKAIPNNIVEIGCLLHEHSEDTNKINAVERKIRTLFGAKEVQ